MSDDSHYEYGEPFQRKILSLLVLDPNFLQNSHDAIKPQYFTYDEHVAVARMILDYHKLFSVPPTKDAMSHIIFQHVSQYNVQEPTRSHLMNLGEYIYAYDFADATYIKERAVHFGLRQSLFGGVSKVLDILKADKDLSKIPSIIEEHSRVGMNRDMGISFRDSYPRIMEMVANDGAYNSTRKCSTLIGGLDRKLGGGLGAGELGSILGTSGGGKSMILINFGAAAMISGKHVIHFTIGDLSEFDVMVRYAARISGVPMEHLVNGDTSYKETIAGSRAVSSYLRIKYFPPKAAYTSHIKAFIAQAKAIDKIDPGLIIVDYADKLATENGGEDDYRDLGRVYDELIGIGREFHVPIWTASQTNRKAKEKKTAGVEDIADSWQKVANADVLISINASDEEQVKNEMRLFGAKVRRGQDKWTIDCILERNRCLLQQAVSKDQ